MAKRKMGLSDKSQYPQQQVSSTRRKIALLVEVALEDVKQTKAQQA